MKIVKEPCLRECRKVSDGSDYSELDILWLVLSPTIYYNLIYLWTVLDILSASIISNKLALSYIFYLSVKKLL